MNLWKAFLLTLLFGIGTAIVGLWQLIPDSLGWHGYLDFFLLIDGALIAGGATLWYFLDRGKKLSLDLNGAGKWMPLAPLMAMGFYFAQVGTWIILQLISGTFEGYSPEFVGLSDQTLLNLLGLAVVIPIGEEIFCRGILQKKLQEKYRPWVAIMIASILFALLHLPVTTFISIIFFDLDTPISFSQTIVAFFGGLATGWLYYRSGSLGPSILFHIFWNLTVILVN